MAEALVSVEYQSFMILDEKITQIIHVNTFLADCPNDD